MGGFNEQLGQQGLPGLGPKVEQESRAFLKDTTHIVRRGVRLDEDTEDTANTPVTKLRAGLVVVRVEAGANKNKYVSESHADAPLTASIVEAGILMQFINMKDRNDVLEDKTASVLIHGFVDNAQLLFGSADAARITALKDAMPLVKFEAQAP